MGHLRLEAQPPIRSLVLEVNRLAAAGEEMKAGLRSFQKFVPADLVRALEIPVTCTFVKPRYRQQPATGPSDVLEIVFSHDLDIRGKDVLLVEGVVHSGVTSEFLMNDLRARGASSVKLATLLDRQSARRVQLQPDYFGFLVDEAFLIGYGLGSPEQTNRNLPYLAAANQAVPMT